MYHLIITIYIYIYYIRNQEKSQKNVYFFRFTDWQCSFLWCGIVREYRKSIVLDYAFFVFLNIYGIHTSRIVFARFSLKCVSYGIASMISRSDNFLQSRYADSISINIDLIADSIRNGSFGISKNQSYFSNTSRIILLNFYDKIWMLTLIHRTMKNIEQNMIHQYIKHHKHHQIVSFIFAIFYDINFFFLCRSKK